MTRVRTTVTLMSLALLHSCGGGGGDGGGGNNPPPPADTRIVIGDGNAIAVGQLSFGPSGNGFEAMQLLTGASIELHQALLAPQTYTCVTGGTIELRAFDDDGSTRLSNGDQVRITYDCSELNGTLTLDITSIAVDGDFITSLDGTVSLDLGFPEGDLTGSGAMQFRVTSIQLRWVGTGFSVSFSNGVQSEGMVRGRIEKVITNDDNTLRYSLTISGTIESDDLDGTFDFTTGQSFEGIEGEWPASGILIAEGRADSSATFQPGSSPGLLQYRVGNGPATEAAWLDIANGVLFSVDGGGGGPPPPPPAAEVLGRRIDLGAPGEDTVVDTQRSKIYVTVPDRNELVVISAATLAVEQRIIVGSQPEGLSISLDNTELFVGLAGSGSIAIVNLDTYAQTDIVVAPTLDTSTVFDVVETSPGILFISSGDTHGSGIRLDRASGTQTAMPAMSEGSQRIELIADPARGALYVGDGWGVFPQNVLKLDITQPSAPLVVRSAHGSIMGTDRMSLNADGSRLYLKGGQVISTADFGVIGTINMPFGVPFVADNDVNVMVAETPGTLSVFTTDTLQEVDQFESDCALSFLNRLAASSVNGQWLMLGDSTLCAIDLNNPDRRPGTGNPGVPPDPVPQRNVAVVDLDLGGTAFDAEFDTSRNRVYVSLTSTGEILTINAANPAILDRDPVLSVPRGLDLSPDESTLAIVFNANGNIGFKDLASGMTERRDLSTTLGTVSGHDISWVDDRAIFVTADAGGGKVVRTNWLDALDTQVVADDRFITDRTTLYPSPDGAFMYVSHRGSEILKLDLTDPNAPILLESGSGGDILGTDRMSISPDGTRIADGFGQILRASDFTRAGNMARGTPLYSGSGAEIFVASQEEAGTLFRVDASTLLSSEELHGNCLIAFPRRLIANAAEDVLVTIGESRACFWFLDQPPARNMKVWTQSPYVCGTGCLLRKYQSQSRVSPSRWRQSVRH